MESKDRLLQLALLTLATTPLATFPAEAAPQKGAKPVECFGINTQKGSNSCGVSQDQIDTANKMFANKFTKTTPVECAGNSNCAANQGFLAWMTKPTNDECFQSGGFIFEKQSDGKFLIRDKKS